MAKRKKSKGKRRGGKKSKVVRHAKKHKPGMAESLGLLATGLQVAKSEAPNVKATIKQPTMANIEYTLRHSWDSAKANAEPALVGIVISNADKLPVIGKMLRPLKRKADRIMKSYTGMGL